MSFFAEKLDESRTEIIHTLEEIKQAVESGDFRPFEYERMSAIMFERHLYQPLLYLGNGMDIEIKPVALNEGEKDFVKDLKKYYDENPEIFEGKKLYLLRNRSRGKGIGFFEAGNFYPDFILWIVKGDLQHVAFVDPHGMGREGIGDPKVQFFKKIKEIEEELGDPQVILDSFIVSPTPLAEIPQHTQSMNKEAWEACHVLFQKDDPERYIEKLFDRLIFAGD